MIIFLFEKGLQTVNLIISTYSLTILL